MIRPRAVFVVRDRQREDGVAMLEVLITILVISFGLLGVAGLQVTGLKNNQMSYLRSVATAQTYDMADRMRANMEEGVKVGKYDSISPIVTYVDPGCANPASATGGCTPAQMAAYDAYAWQLANASLLPQGQGTVSKVAIAGSTDSKIFNITVSWTEKCVPGEGGCATAGTAIGTLTRNFTTQFVP